MGDTNQETADSDAIDDFFEPALSDISVEEDFAPVSTEKQRLAEKRRRAEQRLEQRRLREELGYYDLEFDDF
jgi:glycogen debranching enzyme